MFYSETLLSKTGPLARVWLAANIERKLTKKDVLSSGIERSVHAIVDQGQAPMALRLSGQLLLGVVRIYSRKARYLLDDCNEALLKIKMAFKPGNVDLPANQSHAGTVAALTLPDVLTELDLMAPMPDPELLLAELDLGGSEKIQDPTLLDWGSSQLLNESVSNSFGFEDPLLLDDDLGLDITDAPADTTMMSVEQGRRAPSVARHLDDEFALPEEPTKLFEDDLELDIGQDEPFGGEDTFVAPPLESTENMPPLIDAPTSPRMSDNLTPPPMGEEPARVRDSASPLSSVHSSDVREAPEIFAAPTEPAEEEQQAAQPAPRTKRRRLLQADVTTQITTQDIRAQQQDRSRILRPVSFLPRDPLILGLMQIHQEGSFAANILGGGSMRSWAPELRDLFSLDTFRQTSSLKRKRPSDASIKDVPALVFEEDEAVQSGPTGFPSDGADQFGGDQTEMIDFPPVGAEGEEGIGQVGMSDDEQPLTPLHDNGDSFEETTMPILHPAESGPISVGTKRVVHELRERFGEYSSSPGERRTIQFDELAPEQAASKVDATKMFFEMLVLATKDAIKVEQPSGRLGEPIKIRAKRGLWGAWAEEGAGGVLESEEEPAAAGVLPEKGGPVVASAAARVSVVPLSPQHVAAA